MSHSKAHTYKTYVLQFIGTAHRADRMLLPQLREVWEKQPHLLPLEFPGGVPKVRGKTTLVTCSQTTAQSEL